MIKSMKKEITVAVIGGGIFGSVAAIKLAEKGFSVDLYEKNEKLMEAASGINQYRMHRGYHYPRCSDTIRSCKDATEHFEYEFTEAIISHLKHYYAIAKEGSLISGLGYVDILKEHRLPFFRRTPDHINPQSVEMIIQVEENLFDPFKIREIVYSRLLGLGVNIKSGMEVNVSDLDKYDFVVAATYAGLNESLKGKESFRREYQFEVCEKIVVEVPSELKGVSTVVMDGPFMSFDPMGNTGYAVIGHVSHAVHKRNIGMSAEVPENIKPYLNKGIIKSPVVSNVHKFIESGMDFMPALAKAKYVGSMFTVRTVLPGVDNTDTRPTIVNFLDDRIITIYSGKVVNSVLAANYVVSLIQNKI